MSFKLRKTREKKSVKGIISRTDDTYTSPVDDDDDENLIFSTEKLYRSSEDIFEETLIVDVTTPIGNMIYEIDLGNFGIGDSQTISLYYLDDKKKKHDKTTITRISQDSLSIKEKDHSLTIRPNSKSTICNIILETKNSTSINKNNMDKKRSIIIDSSTKEKKGISILKKLFEIRNRKQKKNRRMEVKLYDYNAINSEDIIKCIKCHKKEKSGCFLPCKCNNYCSHCALQIIASTGKCPACRSRSFYLTLQILNPVV